MSWHFWMIPLAIFLAIRFSRRWRQYEHLHKRRRRKEVIRERDPEVTSELDAQRGYISDLEARVAELENRLDFTERLLATRTGSAESVR